ncbi:MAG: DUF5702 domain-containing protein [Oscillospiraceae bacterium]|jgi:hypothetical protein|nr:DUF5702 domain-containing protein [Oscillospiraceae bacterium]
MKKFRRNEKGTITVIVSIMLIPAILLSGTAVDLARIHTAKSMAQDANQLAANSILTQYNALLQDLYGLFGVAESDPALGSMINDYINIAVFGEKSDGEWIDTGLGTFQTFHGSAASGKVSLTDGFTLENRDVLRRQIEEYMKFRGPVILVQELLRALDIHGTTIKASSEAIEQQEEVDTGMGELFKLYGELYDAIVAADKCPSPGANPNVAGAVGNVNGSLNDIKTAFGDMKSCYASWDSVNGQIESVTEALEEELRKTPPDALAVAKLQDEAALYKAEKEDYERKYATIRERIKALTDGGSWNKWTTDGKGVDMKDGDGNVLKYEDGEVRKEWKPGSAVSAEVSVGLRQNIDAAKSAANAFRANFQTVVDKARAVDSQRETIRADIEKLKGKINDPNCDANLKAALSEQIAECEGLLNQFPNIEGLANKYKTTGNDYIDSVISMLGDIKYRDSSNGSLSISELSGITGNSSFNLSDDVKSDASPAAKYASFGDVTYSMPGGFKTFRNCDGEGSDNERLYDELDGMAKAGDDIQPHSFEGLEDESGSDDLETRQRNIIDQLVTLAENARDGLANNPKGAKRIEDETVGNGSWGSFDVSTKVIDLISNPGGAMQDMADWVLMMTYDVGMFSNYTTQKPAELKKDGEIIRTPPSKSVADIEMSPAVNYFYQSEWEYLLVGDKDANKNLDAVKNLIYAIRLTCNTIASFSNDYIKMVAEAVQVAVSAIPYVGPALGVILKYATHVAFAAAESALDLVSLRNGHKVKLLKMDTSNWTLSRDGVVGLLDEIDDGDISVKTVDEYNNEEGISYEQYMIIFFLVSSMFHSDPIGTLTDRTGNLVEWNVVNYDKKACADNLDDKGVVDTDKAVAAMSSAFAEDNCFRLSKMRTDFDITTTIDLRLLFLTLPVFKGQGAPFSNTLKIEATDYRGY